MLNWTQIVRDRLQPAGITLSDPVIFELAGHLQEAYEAARSQGFTQTEALEQALQEVPDWRVLARAVDRVRSEEGFMNHRTRRLWLPSLITLLGVSASLALFQFVGVRPHLLWVGRLALTFYWAWLATLPMFGALGAYLSRRAHASMPTRLAAGLAPALVMLIVMFLILPWGLAIDGFDFFRLVSFGLGLANWVALPAFALLLGALPFVGTPRIAGTSQP
jgi:hypothetical protein